MDEPLNIVQNTQVALEHPLNVLKYREMFLKILENYGAYLGYIGFILALTVVFILIKFVLKRMIWRVKYRLPKNFNPKLWKKVHMEEEELSLSYLEHLFEKEEAPPLRNRVIPAGSAVLEKILSGIHQGFDNQRILKELVPNFAQIDVLPLMDALRSFRDLCARKILSEKVKDKREYAKALRNLSDGRPQKAIQILRKELAFQEKTLFSLKSKLLSICQKRGGKHGACYWFDIRRL